jgi:hypothetical protein
MEDMRRCLQLILFWCLASATLCVAETSFDLTGPKVDVHIKRGAVTLPIGEVPNLQPGDRIWVHPDLPESQSTHYVLIVAFLRGATNPPPADWFTRVETWDHKVRDEGVFVTVPAEAQQAIAFLVPETGGDFSTLRAAVRGRPGAFVRAVQDLQAASWDRMRLDAYLAEVRITSQTDPSLLKVRAELAARSLGVRVEQQCFDKPSDQQAPCLVQHTDGLVLDDPNFQSKVTELTSGSTMDLVNQLSYSKFGGQGVYGNYIGSIVDISRILSSLHTAHFQYIPALALPTKDTLNLRLSVPPSFRDPKSVVVVALPPVGPGKLPPLHPVTPAESYCVQKPGLVLPADDAPLVFATQLAYGLTLHIDTKSGAIDLPLKAEASQGGLALALPAPLLPEAELTGVVRGKWGFDDWEGPRFHLHSALPGKWSIAAADQSALVVGREDTLHLEGDSSLCVDRIALRTEAQAAASTASKLAWKSPKPELMEVTVPMKDAAPGAVTLEIYQFGLEKPDLLPLKAYAEAATLERLSLSAGDAQALLKGTRLDEVAKVSLDGINWTPAALSRVQDYDQLLLNADSMTTALDPAKHLTASVQLQDGRQMRVPVSIEPPRPQVTLLSKGTQDEVSATPSPVHLESTDDLPVEQRLVFFLRSKVPATFPRDEKIEVATTDGSFRTMLSISDGSLMLEDARTALGVVEPLARFGSSAFGPLRARAVSPSGIPGDWLTLGTLVRLPGFKELHCPRTLAKPCTLTGTNLFLAASIAATSEFDNAATDVPQDFTGTQLSVPHPSNGVLYVKLRDDPETVQALALPVLPMTQPPAPIVPEPNAPAPTATEPIVPAPASPAQTQPDSAPKPLPPTPAKTEK